MLFNGDDMKLKTATTFGIAQAHFAVCPIGVYNRLLRAAPEDVHAPNEKDIMITDGNECKKIVNPDTSRINELEPKALNG